MCLRRAQEMTEQNEIRRWMAEEGLRERELQLSLTGNPRVGAFVPHDMLAILVLLAKRSSAYSDYPFEAAQEMRKVVEEALSLCDPVAHEYIENVMADYHAHVAAFINEEKSCAVPTPLHG
jgi:hypothetical protein